ncbi:MAG TPA: T9SS type A sorting domain-containing protein, partial [Chitinophagales bacterium]|nr:T9SS type A sorting domain-containing protein [Chitinophagales bacterium]
LCDGAESFKYPYDYGDAPSSYGYASHIFRVAPNLMIGSTVDYEMNGYYSAGADDDDNDIRGIGNDEDGVNVNYFVTNPISETNTTYTVPIQLTNRTGADAYLYGYIDFNNDGDYNDAGERSQLVTVPNHPLTQPYSVAWTSLAGGVPGNSFIRFRIGSDEPEINTGSGYARSGEVEDYPIGIHASTLPVELTTFTATALENHTTQLNWATASELNNDHFEIQRSTGDNNWSAIGTVNGNGNSSMLINYSFIDEQPENGINYYRLKQVDYDGTFEYTIVVAVTHNSSIEKNNPVEISVFPNPTTDVLWVKSNYSTPTVSQENIDVYNTNGQQVYSTPHQENLQQVDLKYYENGMYYLKIGKQTFKIIKK